MSADGEVEVKVTAEGTDDAAQELSENGGVAAGGGVSGGGGGSTSRRILAGGIFLAALKLILGLLPGISEFLGAVFSVLQAYLAPLSLLLIRLLSPFLRMMIKFLPTWMDWMDRAAGALEYLGLLFGFIGILALLLDKVPDNIWSLMAGWAGRVVSFLSSLPGQIWSALSSGAAWLGNSLASIATEIGRGVWSFVQRLPRLIGNQIASRIPSVSDTTDTVTNAGSDAVDRVTQAGRDVQVVLEGGLETFVDGVESTSNIDIP